MTHSRSNIPKVEHHFRTGYDCSSLFRKWLAGACYAFRKATCDAQFQSDLFQARGDGECVCIGPIRSSRSHVGARDHEGSLDHTQCAFEITTEAEVLPPA